MKNDLTTEEFLTVKILQKVGISHLYCKNVEKVKDFPRIKFKLKDFFNF